MLVPLELLRINLITPYHFKDSTPWSHIHQGVGRQRSGARASTFDHAGPAFVKIVLKGIKRKYVFICASLSICLLLKDP